MFTKYIILNIPAKRKQELYLQKKYNQIYSIYSYIHIYIEYSIPHETRNNWSELIRLQSSCVL